MEKIEEKKENFENRHHIDQKEEEEEHEEQQQQQHQPQQQSQLNLYTASETASNPPSNYQIEKREANETHCIDDLPEIPDEDIISVDPSEVSDVADEDILSVDPSDIPSDISLSFTLIEEN